MNATARLHGRQVRGVVPTQNGEAAFAAVLAASGLPADKCDVLQDHPRRRLRPARRCSDYVQPGGADRQADAGHAGQADLVARRGHDCTAAITRSRSASCVGALRRGQQPDRPAHAHLRPVDPGRRASADRWQNGTDPADVPGPQPRPAPKRAFGYTIPNLLIDHAMRNPHVPPGFWRGVNINQNASIIECFMDELAHAAGQDPLEFRRKLMSEASEAPRACSTPWPRGSAGASRRRRACIAALAQHDGVTAAMSRPPRRSRSSGGNKIKIHRIVGGDRSAAMPSTRRRSSGRSRARSSTACPPLFYQECTVKDGAHRADELRHLQLDAHRRDAEGRDRSSCRPAAVPGAASASRPSAWRRRRCSTRIFAATGKRIRSFPLKNHKIAHDGVSETGAAAHRGRRSIASGDMP